MHFVEMNTSPLGPIFQASAENSDADVVFSEVIESRK